MTYKAHRALTVVLMVDVLWIARYVLVDPIQNPTHCTETILTSHVCIYA